MKRKRHMWEFAMMMLLLMMAILAGTLVQTIEKRESGTSEAPEEWQKTTMTESNTEEEIKCLQLIPKEYKENPFESLMIQKKVLNSAYTEEAVVCVGYDWDFVCRVVMAEAGADTEEEQMTVCTCCMNTCRRTMQNPEEVMRDGYAEPSKPEDVTEQVKRVCERVFLLGEFLPEVEDGEIFYSTDGGFHSEWHEKQEYVTTVGSIRVFRYNAETIAEMEREG